MSRFDWLKIVKALTFINIVDIEKYQMLSVGRMGKHSSHYSPVLTGDRKCRSCQNQIEPALAWVSSTRLIQSPTNVPQCQLMRFFTSYISI